MINTSSNVNITSYLDKYPEQFSLFRKMIERAGTDGFLQAYGKYTLFLPTNDGVKAYLAKAGKNSVDDIDLGELKDVVNFHILNDTISTSKFSDGKISALTLQGQYLTTGVTLAAGITKLTVNKQGDILTSNVRVGNGIIHVISQVLLPAKNTLAKMIESDPNYSVFTQALKATGWYDSLNVIPSNNPIATRKFLTVLAESNSVLNAAGFPDFISLKARLSPGSGDPKNVMDSLHTFIGYHIIPGANYLADFATLTSLNTLAPPDILNISRSAGNILINDIVFNGIYEPGSLISRSSSDLSASNGVLHAMAPYSSTAGITTGHFAIKIRKPVPVYWDVCDFPEIRAIPSIFRQAGSASTYFSKYSATDQPISGWDWERKSSGTPTAPNNKYDQRYLNYTGACYNDVLNPSISIPTAANSGAGLNSWIYMKTPVIVKGRYKVWICYSRDSQGGGDYPLGRRVQCRVLVDGVTMAKPFDFSEPPPIVPTMSELESQGWKYYMSNPVVATAPSSKPFIGKLVGIVDIAVTNVHQVRLEVIQGNQSLDRNKLDMIHFIPTDWPSQVLPRFRPDGTQDFTPIP